MAEILEKQLEFPFMEESQIAEKVLKYIYSQQYPNQRQFLFMNKNESYIEREAKRIGEALILTGTYFFIGTGLLLDKLLDKLRNYTIVKDKNF